MDTGPSWKLVEFFGRLKLPPMIHLKTADVTVSLWVLAAVGIVTGVIIVLCVISRAIAIPMYMRQLGYLHFDKAWDHRCNLASKIFLFASGITGVLVILYHVTRAYRQRRKIRKTLRVVRKT